MFQLRFGILKHVLNRRFSCKINVISVLVTM